MTYRFLAGAGDTRHPRPSVSQSGTSKRGWIRFALVFAGILVGIWPATASAAVDRYQSDAWITICEATVSGHPECSLTVPFGGSQGGEKGAFALVVILDSDVIGIVGKPYPVRAVLRIDKDPPFECDERRYCLFSPDQSLAAIKDLEVGSLILIDVYTARSTFRFSLTPRGYQAGIAQIRAWGYPFPQE